MGAGKADFVIRGGSRQSFYARPRRDAVRRLGEARWALGQGLVVTAGTTSLRVYLQSWLMVRRTRLRPITLVTYARDARRLADVLGDTPLRSLAPGLIQSAYAGLLDQGFSKRTVEKTHAVLHRAMDQAMHWGLIARNPTELVNPPRPARREMTALPGTSFNSYYSTRLEPSGITSGCCSAPAGCVWAKRLGCTGWTSTWPRAGWPCGARFNASGEKG